METNNQIQAKEALRNTCINYNLHQYIPGVQKAIELNTWGGYRIMVLKLEGRVSGVAPEDMNLLIGKEGQSNARVIIQELKDIIKQGQE